MVLCCYLLRCGEHVSADEAMKYYGIVRTSSGSGVTINSQARYVRYFGELTHFSVPRRVLVDPPQRTLIGVQIRTAVAAERLFLKVEQDVKCVGAYASDKWKSNTHPANTGTSFRPQAGRELTLDIRADLRLRGDVLVQVSRWAPSSALSYTLLGTYLTPALVHDLIRSARAQE